MEKLASSHGWKIQTETKDFKKNEYERVGRVYVERLEDTIVDCVKEWAFADAFASLQQHYKKVDWDKISRRYWERLSGSNVRVGSVLLTQEFTELDKKNVLKKLAKLREGWKK
ncbi:MAG: hypothetical protein LAO31_13520 [Acidobacteriia bacterium]|nr:hypothetical protein [Terriglobia bacterium]